MRRTFAFLIPFLTVILLAGCAPGDWWRATPSDAERSELAEKLAAREKEAADLRTEITAFKAGHGDQLTPGARNALAKAEETLAVLEGELPQLRKSLAAIPPGASNGSMVMTLAAGYALRYAPKLLTFIPGFGSVLAPLAEFLAHVEWKATATPRQKREDDDAVNALAALKRQQTIIATDHA